MDVGLLSIGNNHLISGSKASPLSFAVTSLYKNGFNIKANNSTSAEASTIEENIKAVMSLCDCIIIAAEDYDYAFTVKKAIAKMYNEELITNVYAKNNMALYYKNNNLPQPKESLSYAYTPKSARAIVNELGPMQGFLMNIGEKMLVFMPLASREFKAMFKTSVLPFLVDKQGKGGSVSIFKTFGLTANEILSVLKDIRKNKQRVVLTVNESLLDSEIIVTYPQNADQFVVDGFASTIYKRLSSYIYADTDTTLPETLFSLLSIKNNTLVCAEDSTKGNFINTFYNLNLDANKYLPEGYVVPTDQSKIKILGVEADLFNKSDVDANEVVYQMAVGALENATTDYVVSTYAKDDTFYLGVGNHEGIHVYTQTFNLQENKIEIFTNAAYFNLIKKIKKNDFHLQKATI